MNIEVLGAAAQPIATQGRSYMGPGSMESVSVFTSDPLFFHKPESVTVSAQARQYAHSRITLVEVPMGKLALFLGGFLLLTILIGILGTIPPS
ncbi:hypothetical protein IR012_25860 [Pseudomonas putida]|uniref:hypothetical protein n=1 Tax=Pseudomonas putida TaxID=303 RepID=UPI0018A9C459|nr:hypothetical protein [Pseudomonas putida]MBF8672613.1 hypothetical protein [Pseudomonas putida]MBF8715738.1 hypothetical protein [Pseudomonas putida]